MEGLLIGEVATRAGVIVETVRFYERERLIPLVPRGRSKYRRYPLAIVQRIRFIRRSKELGFTLEEIRDLLALRDREGGCGKVRARAIDKIAALDERMAALARMRAALADLAETCSDEPNDMHCPILHALDEEDADDVS
jgi:MerR family transcriptional regulator, copper efflux regulator